jgi:hypothetical protein
MVKQIMFNEGEQGLAELALLAELCRSEGLNVRDAIKLGDLFARVLFNDPIYSKLCLSAIELLVEKFGANSAFISFLARLIEVGLAQVLENETAGASSATKQPKRHSINLHLKLLSK